MSSVKVHPRIAVRFYTPAPSSRQSDGNNQNSIQHNKATRENTRRFSPVGQSETQPTNHNMPEAKDAVRAEKKTSLKTMLENGAR